MTEIQPAHYTEQACHTAQGDRQVLSSIVCGEGVAFGASNGDNLEVTDGVAALAVVVGSGNAFIEGDTIAWQGMYHVTNDGDVTLTVAGGDPTDGRIDTIIARVYDADYAGALNEWRLEVLPGDPSPSPSPYALPANSIPLAYVAVAAGATSVSSGDITDARAGYTLCSGGGAPSVLVMESSGSFSKADYPGLLYVEVFVQGQGGGGGGSTGTAAGESAVGSGGGAGSCGFGIISAAALLDTETVTVGTAGGTGGAPGNGTDGDDSAFGTHVSGLGGGGGLSGIAGSTDDATEGAAGQVGGVGDWVIAGGGSEPSFRSATPVGSFSSSGGDSHLGSGGHGRATEGNGHNGVGYGAGGGGARSGASNGTGQTGGQGADGVVIVKIYR